MVSGMEPENTNIFLLALAECAADASLDIATALRMCMDGVNPGDVPPPRKGGVSVLLDGIIYINYQLLQ